MSSLQARGSEVPGHGANLGYNAGIGLNKGAMK